MLQTLGQMRLLRTNHCNLIAIRTIVTLSNCVRVRKLSVFLLPRFGNAQHASFSKILRSSFASHEFGNDTGKTSDRQIQCRAFNTHLTLFLRLMLVVAKLRHIMHSVFSDSRFKTVVVFLDTIAKVAD